MKKLLFILLFLFLGINNFAAILSANDKMKAVFIYNFLKYIEWAPEDLNGTLVIGVKDAPELYEELLLITKIKKTVGSQTVVIKKIDDCNEKVHLLFVGKSYTGSYLALQVIAKKNHTLVVSDMPGSIHKGIEIELAIGNGKAEFDISRRHIKECKLFVSQLLLGMARSIE